MKRNKNLRRLLGLCFVVVTSYFLVYAILSFNGSYQVLLADLDHEEYGWIPLGFYPPEHQQPNWVNSALFRIYLPLFQLDQIYIHKNPPPPTYFPRPEDKN
jgi:hypothetical protein